jgi:uncharacterized protein (DUF2384 family)
VGSGERQVGSSERERRLRAAAHVAWLITEAFNTRTAQAWMQGTDPMLNDRSPAWVLRHATDETDRAAVLASARRFVVQ